MRQTKAQALQAFFEEFGLKAYERYSVPDNSSYPYITYDYATAAWGDGETPLTCDIWYRDTKSNVVINDKAQEIADAIGGGVFLACAGGRILLRRGSPFVQPVGDPDPKIKRRHINLTAEYLTAN